MHQPGRCTGWSSRADGSYHTNFAHAPGDALNQQHVYTHGPAQQRVYRVRPQWGHFDARLEARIGSCGNLVASSAGGGRVGVPKVVCNEMTLAASNYSYTANCEVVAGNFLNESFPSACAHLATAGWRDVYLLPGQFFSPDPEQQLSIGSESCTPEQLRAVRDAATSSGLRIHAMLVPDAPAGERNSATRYRRVIDHAAELRCCWLIDFGVPAGPEEADYIAMMRAVAGHAKAREVGISMKLHRPFATGDEAMAELLRVHEAVGHPSFGLCMDPGNLSWHPHFAAQSKAGAPPPYHLPPETLQAEAHRFTTVIVKDCVIEPAATAMVQPGRGVVDLPTIVGALRKGGFDGPLLIEKLPGMSIEELNTNMATALKFCEELPANPPGCPNL